MIQGDKVEILDTGNVKLITPKEDGDANVERKVDTIYQQPDSRLRVEIATETGDHMNTSSHLLKNSGKSSKNKYEICNGSCH